MGRRLLADQAHALADLLKALALEQSAPVGAFSEAEKKVQDSLARAGIGCDEVFFAQEEVFVTAPESADGEKMRRAAERALGVPLIPVHHIRGHIAANYLAFPELEPPFLALCISGGNSMLVDVRGYTDMEIVGATRDDAAGECFDKAARVLGLPYPGGAPMDALAKQSSGGVYQLPHAHVDGAPLDMSFSGLKTAVVNLAHHAQQVGEELDRAALARDFAQAVSDTLVPRAMEAARQTGRTVIAAAGGVAANSVIRGDLERCCREAGYKLYLPPLRLCGDNGAMIGAQGYYEYLAGHTAGMDLNAYATRDIAE